MAKLIGIVALALVTLAAVEAQKISSEEEFKQRLEPLGRIEPDEMQKLLGQLDLEADVELYLMDARNLQDLSIINRENCRFEEVSYRMQICRNLDYSEDPHWNMRRFCWDRSQKQFDLCKAQLEELFSQSLAQMETSDQKLALEFKRNYDEALEKLKASHQADQIKSSCRNVAHKLRLVELLASGDNLEQNKEMANWMTVKNICDVHLAEV